MGREKIDVTAPVLGEQYVVFGLRYTGRMPRFHSPKTRCSRRAFCTRSTSCPKLADRFACNPMNKRWYQAVGNPCEPGTEREDDDVPVARNTAQNYACGLYGIHGVRLQARTIPIHLGQHERLVKMRPNRARTYNAHPHTKVSRFRSQGRGETDYGVFGRRVRNDAGDGNQAG